MSSRISQHHYSAAFCNGGSFPLVSFMSKPSIRGNLSIFNADIAATHAQGLPYILGYAVNNDQHVTLLTLWLSLRETNSIACHGAPGVSNTAGIALWVIDYTLQAATLGIQEAFFHEGVGYKYNFVCLLPYLKSLFSLHRFSLSSPSDASDSVDPTCQPQSLNC